MKTKQDILLEMRITDIILEVVRLETSPEGERLTTSDLQGIAQSRAMEIIKLVKEVKP